MNVFEQDFGAPRRLAAPPVDGMVLDFGQKRAGRAIADLQHVNEPIISTSAHLARVLVWGRAIRGRVLERPAVRRATSADEKAGMLVIGDAIADTRLMANDDEAIVRWFTEQEAAAEEAIREGSASSDLEDNEEVVLTRRGATGRRQSWRGGSTMRRR